MRAASSLEPSRALVRLDGEDELLLLRVDGLGAPRGGSLDALLDERRGDHEDDEEHEHHVDERRR
jgi:hypothetical protein